MEWSKAKNFTLILLVIINLILFGLNVSKNRSNYVDSGRISNITNVCEKSNIKINCQLPQYITPMAQLGIREYTYDYVKLQQIFFGSITGVNRTSSLNSVIFTKGNEKMVVENSKVVFNGEKKDYSSCISGINELLGEFNAKNERDSVTYYYQTYNDMPVFSNYICVDNSGDNTVITLNYSEILRGVGARENMIGSDEAVYAAIDFINEDIQGEKVITSVEKGYYDSRSALSQDGTVPPVYGIYVNDRVYFVNGYTGLCYR